MDMGDGVMSLETYGKRCAVVCKTCNGVGINPRAPFYTNEQIGNTCRNCGGKGWVWSVITFVKVDETNGSNKEA